jgi:hypothetical protein
MFKVGEKVVCIEPILVLVKNEIYNIKEIHNCKCGFVTVSVENIDLSKEFNFTECDCGRAVNNPNLWDKKRFRKLDYQFGYDICAELSRQYNEDFVEL